MSFDLIQQQILRRFLQKTFTTKLKINSTITKKITVDYDLSLINNSNNSIENNKKYFLNSIKEFSQFLNLNVLLKKVSMGSNLELYQNSALQKNTTYFFDLFLQKSITAPKMDLTLSVLNIFNNNKYVSTIFLDNNISNNLFILRPFQIKLSLKAFF
jgi:hypothetical protein